MPSEVSGDQVESSLGDIRCPTWACCWKQGASGQGRKRGVAHAGQGRRWVLRGRVAIGKDLWVEETQPGNSR